MSEEENTISVTSIVSGRLGKGMVQIEWGEKRCQLTVKEAREHAFGILECCEAARSDELVFQFMIEKVGIEPAKAALILHDFRGLRNKAEEEKNA